LTLPSGDYLPHIALADAMVINGWPKKSSCGVVKSLFEASVKKGTKQTLYSAHRSDKLHRMVERHD
jgi:hypothetical protein